MTSAVQVSVALASFNGERYIAEQLRSILDQSRLPDEIVVSDGGSDDGTARIVREVLMGAGSGMHVEVLADGTRLSITDNFARAIAATRGRFIALSDQDDRWHPDRLARGLARLEQPGVLLSAGNARLVAADGWPLGVDLFTALGIGRAEVAALGGTNAFPLLLRRNLVTGATVVFRRELLGAALPFPAEWVHDEWLAILATALGRLAVDPVPLIDYRQHGRNQIGVTSPTLRYRIRRMLEPRGDRYHLLSRRSDDLVTRLSELPVSPDLRELAVRKAEFERVRAGYGTGRLSRVPQVLAAARSRAYRDLSSQGALDIARDLLQPE